MMWCNKSTFSRRFCLQTKFPRNVKWWRNDVCSVRQVATTEHLPLRYYVVVYCYSWFYFIWFSFMLKMKSTFKRLLQHPNTLAKGKHKLCKFPFALVPCPSNACTSSIFSVTNRVRCWNFRVVSQKVNSFTVHFI